MFFTRSFWVNHDHVTNNLKYVGKQTNSLFWVPPGANRQESSSMSTDIVKHKRFIDKVCGVHLQLPPAQTFSLM